MARSLFVVGSSMIRPSKAQTCNTHPRLWFTDTDSTNLSFRRTFSEPDPYGGPRPFSVGHAGSRIGRASSYHVRFSSPPG